MSNVCFAFGPANSCFFNSPSQWYKYDPSLPLQHPPLSLPALSAKSARTPLTTYRYKLPSAVQQLFTKQPPIKDVFEIVLGSNNSYYIGYLDHDGKAYCKNQGLGVHLTKWLSTNAKGFVDYDIRTTSITLGPNGSYVVKDKNKMQWFNIPTPLAEKLKTAGTKGTKLVALGIDESYVWYLSLSSYTSLDKNGAVDNPGFALVMKNGSSDYEIADDHFLHAQALANTMPNMLAVQSNSSSGWKTFFKVLGDVAKVANEVVKVENNLNNINGGGGGGNGGGGGFDMSGFTAGLQQQTWSTTQNAASDPIHTTAGAPGLSSGIIHHGTTIHTHQLGRRDIHAPAPPDADTIFSTYSLIKAMVAAAVGVLVEEGDLTWTTPAHEILPELRARCCCPRARGCTRSVRCPCSIRSGRATATKFPLRSEGGSWSRGWWAGGKTLGAFLRVRFFEPLGMQSTYTENLPARCHDNVAKS
ncbi:hypothetical protein MMC08_003116 [Hypocenomyce scalaris]|nr:hypothetical protein [Hypocenomyce scalaris]